MSSSLVRHQAGDARQLLKPGRQPAPDGPPSSGAGNHRDPDGDWFDWDSFIATFEGCEEPLEYDNIDSVYR